MKRFLISIIPMLSALILSGCSMIGKECEYCDDGTKASKSCTDTQGNEVYLCGEHYDEYYNALQTTLDAMAKHIFTAASSYMAKAEIYGDTIPDELTVNDLKDELDNKYNYFADNLKVSITHNGTAPQKITVSFNGITGGYPEQ